MRELLEEDRSIRQRFYGYYCNLCRSSNTQIKPYHDFKLEDFYDLRSTLKLKEDLR